MWIACGLTVPTEWHRGPHLVISDMRAHAQRWCRPLLSRDAGQIQIQIQMRLTQPATLVPAVLAPGLSYCRLSKACPGPGKDRGGKPWRSYSRGGPIASAFALTTPMWRVLMPEMSSSIAGVSPLALALTGCSYPGRAHLVFRAPIQLAHTAEAALSASAKARRAQRLGTFVPVGNPPARSGARTARRKPRDPNRSLSDPARSPTLQRGRVPRAQARLRRPGTACLACMRSASGGR